MNMMNLTLATLINRSVIDVICHKQTLSVVMSSTCMLLLILDPVTALNGATRGIDQCIQVILPSLFPFFVITTYLNSRLLGMRIPGVHFISRLLHIPDGGDSILLLGMIGGYPVGAQAIADGYRQGTIPRDSAKILLGYCNNAGPAFIFGVTSFLFSSHHIPLLLWFIQILSMIITGLLLPRVPCDRIILNNDARMNLVTALKKSIHNIAFVCGWIILFKILLSYLSKVTLPLHSDCIKALLAGMLELSNGCLDLTEISSESLRFIFCSIFLSFGGLCVLLQTMSTVDHLGLGYYLPGKIIQTSASCLLSVTISRILFPQSITLTGWHIFTTSLCICIIIVTRQFCKKRCGNPT